MTGQNCQMGPRLASVMLAALVLCCLAAAGNAANPMKPENTKPQHPAFDEFRVIIDRNMFATSNKSASGASQEPPAAEPLSQTLRLMGTWIRGDQARALFEESPGNAVKTVEFGDFIADCMVLNICADAIVLHNEQGDIEVPLGASLGKAENGLWTLIDKAAPDPPAAVKAAAPQTAPAQVVTSNAGQKPESDDRTGRKLRKSDRVIHRRNRNDDTL